MYPVGAPSGRAEATGALAGGGLAAAAGVQTPILAGVLPLISAAMLLARPAIAQTC